MAQFPTSDFKAVFLIGVVSFRSTVHRVGFPGGTMVKNLPDNQRRQWHPTPVLLPGKSHGWRSLVGCSPWGLEESDMTERLHFHFSLSCIGEGNGNPLQCSCLENPRDRGAWWAAVNGVAQSWTRLRRLSSKLYQKIPKPSTRTSIKRFKKDVSKKSYQLGMFHMPGMIAGTIKTQLVLASIL